MNNVIKNFKNSRVIRKAMYGMPVMPIFSEADAGFQNSREQLRNEIRRANQKQLKEDLNNKLKIMRDRATSIPSNDGLPVPSDTRIPIYAEPDDTLEWLKKKYYYLNPSREPMKANQYDSKIR